MGGEGGGIDVLKMGKSGSGNRLFGLVFSVVSTDDVERRWGGGLFLLPFFWRPFFLALVSFLVCITRKYRGGRLLFSLLEEGGGVSSLDWWIMLRVELKGKVPFFIYLYWVIENHSLNSI